MNILGSFFVVNVVCVVYRVCYDKHRGLIERWEPPLSKEELRKCKKQALINLLSIFWVVIILSKYLSLPQNLLNNICGYGPAGCCMHEPDSFFFVKFDIMWTVTEIDIHVAWFWFEILCRFYFIADFEVLCLL